MNKKRLKLTIILVAAIIPVIIYFFLNSGFLKNQIKTKLSNFVLEKYNIRLKIDDLSFFNLSGELKLFNVKVKFNEFEPGSEINDLEIKSVSVSLGLFQSLFNKITVKEINIRDPRLRLISENGNIKNLKLPDFKKDEDEIQKIQKKITKRGKELLPKKRGFIDLDIKKINIDNLYLYGRFDQTSFDIKTNIVLNKNKNEINSKISFENSWVEISGKVLNGFDFKNLEFKGETSFLLGKELALLDPEITENINIKGSAAVNYKGKNLSFPKFLIYGDNLKNSYFSIDELTIEGNFKDNLLSIKKGAFEIDNSKLSIISTITINKNFSISGQLETSDDNLTLEKIFKASSSSTINLNTKINGSILFEGNLSPFSLTLNPNLFAENLTYELSPKNKVFFPSYKLNGEAKVSSTYIDFTPVEIIERNRAQKTHRLEGKIIYTEGFSNFDIFIKDLKLEKLSLFGFNNINGTLSLKTSLNGYYTKPEGEAKFSIDDVKYGKINLPKLTGMLESKDDKTTLKKGTIEFEKNKINLKGESFKDNFSLSVDTKNLKLESFAEMFSESLLENLRGLISFDLNVNQRGEELSINANILGEKLFIFGERIEKVKFSINEAKKGKSSFEIKKAGGILKGSGQRINSELNYKIISENLKLSDFNLIPRVANGDIFIDGHLIGTLKKPDMRLKIKFLNSTIRGKALSNTNLDVYYKNDILSFSGNIMGKNALLKGRKNLYGLSADLNFENFDFSPLLSLVSSNYSQSLASFTANISIKDENLSGNVKEFKIIKERNDLNLEKEFFFSINKNEINLTPISLIGRGIDIKLLPEKNINNILSLDFKTDINLSLFYPAIPSVTNANGLFNYRGTLSYDPIAKKLLKGSASGTFENINLGIMALSQLFEKINGSFSHDLNHINLENITGSFGGGSFKTFGKFYYNPHISSDIKLSLENVTIRHKEHLQGKIDAGLTLTGKGFPLLLKGKIDLKSGLFSQNINYQKFIRDALKGKKRYALQTLTQRAKIIKFDLDIKSRDFLVNNNLLRTNLFSDLSIGGDNTKPTFSGFIKATSGFFNFKSYKHNIKNINVKFDSKDILDPKFFIETIADFKSHTVTTNIRGSLRGDTQINFSSKPPLEKNRILLLMATGSAEGSDEDLAKAQAFDLFLEVGQVTSIAEKITGLDRIRIAPGRYQGKTSRKGNLLLTAEKDLSDDIVLKFVSTEDFSAYKLNLDYYISPSYRLEAGKESEENISSSSIDLIWEKSYK